MTGDTSRDDQPPLHLQAVDLEGRRLVVDGVEPAEVAADAARLEQLEAAAVDLVAGEDLLLSKGR